MTKTMIWWQKGRERKKHSHNAHELLIYFPLCCCTHFLCVHGSKFFSPETIMAKCVCPSLYQAHRIWIAGLTDAGEMQRLLCQVSLCFFFYLLFLDLGERLLHEISSSPIFKWPTRPITMRLNGMELWKITRIMYINCCQNSVRCIFVFIIKCHWFSYETNQRHLKMHPQLLTFRMRMEWLHE